MAHRAPQELPAQEIKETALLSPIGLLSQKATAQRHGVRAEQSRRNKQKESSKMRRERNNPQRKEKRNPQEEC